MREVWYWSQNGKVIDFTEDSKKIGERPGQSMHSTFVLIKKWDAAKNKITYLENILKNG
jgi:hypothetical protein